MFISDYLQLELLISYFECGYLFIPGHTMASVGLESGQIQG